MARTQGDRLSESIPLPSGRCDPNDCFRAFVCAEAVLRPQNSDIEEFFRGIQKEFPFIEFGDIHVSVDLNPDYGLQFLVANAADAIFIAFQVSQNVNNSLGSALCTLPSGGQVDSEVCTLSDGLKFLTEIYGFHKEKRVVFCGREFGGALAHMVVLQFLAPLFKSDDKGRQDLSRMISIAFGAPYICSSTYAEEVNGNSKLKSHFFDFVHEHDPRRSILADVYDRDGNSSAGRESNLEVGRVVGTRNAVDNRANHGASNIRKASTTTHMNRPSRSANLKTCEEPKFFPIGETSVLKGSNTSASDSLGPQFTSNPRSRDTFFNSYKSALALALPTSTSKPSDPNSKLVLRVTTPTPVIKSAKLKAMDSGRFVHVEGNNLLFLREPVKMNGLNPWISNIQKDNELYLFEPPQTDVKKEGNDCMENALPFIVLKTAFGEASHLVSENNLSGGLPTGARRLLPKIVQTFVALASAPLRITQSSELLADLDSIVQCVPGLTNETLSKALREIANAKTDKDLKEDIMKINTTVEKVVEFLTRSCKIEYEHTLPVNFGYVFGGALLFSGLTTLPMSVISSIAFGFAWMLNFGATTTAVAVLLSKKALMIPEYCKMLQIAIQEAQLWPDDKGQTSKHDLEKDEVVLESLLAEEVGHSGDRLTKMVDQIHKFGVKAQNIVFHSKDFKGATFESKGLLLRRMQIVTKTLHVYNMKVKDMRFVGVFGAEDAGKSTFIRKALLEGEPYSEEQDPKLPDVGNNCHTSTVRAYKLRTKENFYLVDFPGSNGTGAYADGWKQFTSLPSSCVLLLDFKNDIKQDQVDMYKKMKDDLGSKVSVVFNKVDEKFSPRYEAIYNAEYFNKLRANTAKMLKCLEDDVHFACLYPDPEERLIKLKKVGVLDFYELFKKIV